MDRFNFSTSDLATGFTCLLASAAKALCILCPTVDFLAWPDDLVCLLGPTVDGFGGSLYGSLYGSLLLLQPDIEGGGVANRVKSSWVWVEVEVDCPVWEVVVVVVVVGVSLIKSTHCNGP